MPASVHEPITCGAWVSAKPFTPEGAKLRGWEPGWHVAWASALRLPQLISGKNLPRWCRSDESPTLRFSMRQVRSYCPSVCLAPNLKLHPSLMIKNNLIAITKRTVDAKCLWHFSGWNQKVFLSLCPPYDACWRRGVNKLTWLHHWQDCLKENQFLPTEAHSKMTF